MQSELKRRLRVIDNSVDSVVHDITCFGAHEKYGVSCERKHCQQWISHPESNNCVMIAAQKGPHTLQEIGKIYGLTRMRICQIEKGIYKKIKEKS